MYPVVCVYKELYSIDTYNLLWDRNQVSGLTLFKFVVAVDESIRSELCILLYVTFHSRGWCALLYWYQMLDGPFCTCMLLLWKINVPAVSNIHTPVDCSLQEKRSPSALMETTDTDQIYQYDNDNVFGWLVLMASADFLWEKIIVGWLVLVGWCWFCVWEKYCWLDAVKMKRMTINGISYAHLVRDGCGSVGKQLKETNIVIPMNSMLTVNSMNYSKFSTLASNLA